MCPLRLKQCLKIERTLHQFLMLGVDPLPRLEPGDPGRRDSRPAHADRGLSKRRAAGAAFFVGEGSVIVVIDSSAVRSLHSALLSCGRVSSVGRGASTD